VGEIREGWYEREEIQKVTQEWVRANCRLTGREKELLQLVYDRKLVRRDHLEIISPSYRRAGDNRTILLNRAIKKMFHQMCFDKIHEKQEIGKGNTPSILAIDKGGSIILGVPHKKRITHRTSIVKGIRYITRFLPSNYKHINGVNQIEVDTILFCEATNNDLLRWELEVATIFHHSGEEILFIPDIFMEIAFKKPLLAFIEYDTGSENHRNKDSFPIIYNKLLNYRRYKASKLWVDKYAYFPIILLVTEDEKRIPYFNQKCKEFGLRGLGVYCENYTKILKGLEGF
jgi:hypothetical protein